MFPFYFGLNNFLWHLGSSIAHDCMRKHSEGWLICGWCRQFFFFYLLYANPFSCCIQRQASCSNLLTVLVKLLSKLLSLIETCSLWLWQSLNHSCHAVIFPPAGPFGVIPCCCRVATKCRYWKALPPNDQFYYVKYHIISDNCEIWQQTLVIQY